MDYLTFVFCIILSSLSACHCLKTSQPTNFSQHLGVYFSPFVSRHTRPELYTHTDIYKMTETISTKFRKMMMPPFSDSKEAFAKIPDAVADFNRGHSEHPMELIMTFKQVGFNITKRYADRVNNLSANTVKILLYSPDELHVTEGSLDSESNIGNITEKSYAFGIYMPIENCSHSLSPALTQVVTNFKSTFFSWCPSSVDFLLGGVCSAKKLIKMANSCKANLVRVNPNVNLGLQTHWPSEIDGAENLTEFVLFWLTLNDFAESTNTTVIASDAFDSPFKGNEEVGHGTMGWWRLVDNGESELASAGYEFVEKAEGVVIPTSGRSCSLGAEEKPKSDKNSAKMDNFVMGACIFLIVIGVLSLILLFNYLTSRRARLRQQVILTLEEIQHFFHGADPAYNASQQEYLFEYPDQRRIELEAYDTSLEVDINTLTLYHDDKRGSGTFGLVVRGDLKRASGTVVPVAVKMTKPSCPKTALKGLLSEIKIMSHVGAHDNILRIMGAYTAELTSGKVYVLTELCNLGSLEGYLVNLKADYSRVVNCSDEYENTGNRQYVNTREPPHFVQDLDLWSYQIACGMEYLVSKHVVHADLATRNVLLTDNKMAKISDFGLSRRLYDYAGYVKKQHEPLPWRWMSPEALSRLVFSEMSDVWAFGVTLWEMYSLGDIPYAGQVWTVDWVAALEDGSVKLKKPKWSDKNMYHIMMKCCETDQKLRPSFADLKRQLEVEFQSCNGR